MKKLFSSAAFCAATLLGLSGCSSDPVMPEPVNPAVGIVDGISPGPVVTLNPRIIGPESIELDRLYTFTATSGYVNDTFTFTVKDTYFNDPRSYGINVSTSGTRINVVFNDYGHYTITAKSRLTGKECSYEVAKYYKEIGELRYYSNAPGLRDGMEGGRKPVSRRFERYQGNSHVTNYTQRIVVNTVEYFMEYWYPMGGTPYMKRGSNRGTITGIAAKGANSITLPDGHIMTHPGYDPVTLNNCALLVPFCEQEVTIPEERCGAL